MQTTYQLLTGGAFKLTTARITWPNKQRTCINGVGVTTAIDGVVEAQQNGAIETALVSLKN